MQKWEYAELTWYQSASGAEEEEGESSGVLVFSHNDGEEELEEGAFRATLRRLGEAGWELVSTYSHRQHIPGHPPETHGSTHTETVYTFKPPR